MHACKGKNEDLKIRCPVSNVLKESFEFDLSHMMSCKTTPEKIENTLQQKFRTCNKTSTCMFTPAELVNDDNCLYMSKELHLIYSCINGTGKIFDHTNYEELTLF